VLTSNGAGALPSWASSGGGLGNVLLSTATASASSTLDFTTGIDGTYSLYTFVYTNIVLSNGGPIYFAIRTSSNGGSSYDSGANNYKSSAGASLTYIPLFVLASPAANAPNTLSGYVTLANPSETSLYKVFYGVVSIATSSGGSEVSGASRTSTSAINAVQFFPTAGTITSGTIKLYGVQT
jgi:hypothetical protein